VFLQLRKKLSYIGDISIKSVAICRHLGMGTPIKSLEEKFYIWGILPDFFPTILLTFTEVVSSHMSSKLYYDILFHSNSMPI